MGWLAVLGTVEARVSCLPVLDVSWVSGGDGERTDEDHDEVEHGGGEKEAEHPVGGEAG